MCSCVQVFTVFSFPKYILIKNIWRFFSDSVNNIYSVLFDKDKNEDKEDKNAEIVISILYLCLLKKLWKNMHEMKNSGYNVWTYIRKGKRIKWFI